MGNDRAYRYSPVQSCRKFSAVFGQISAKSSNFTRPAGCSPTFTSKKTTGFSGRCGLMCHCSVVPVAIPDYKTASVRPIAGLVKLVGLRRVDLS